MQQQPSSSDLDGVIKQLTPHLSEYLEEKGINTRRNFKCINPKHDDSTPSCSLFGSKDNPVVYCHGCNFYGDILTVAAILEDLPRSGHEWRTRTVKHLADKYGVPFEPSETTEVDEYRTKVLKAYSLVSQLLLKQAQRPAKSIFQEEVRVRGWDEGKLAEWGIGCVKSFAEFRDALLANGLDDEFIHELDLDKYELFGPDSMIFTWFDQTGQPIYFNNRNLTYVKGGAGSKYNSLTTSRLKHPVLARKGSLLYGLQIFNQESRPRTVYLFEGQPDVITAKMFGIENCLALGSTTLSDAQLRLLLELGVGKVIVALDGDQAGQEATAKIVDRKLSGQQAIRVEVLELPDGLDPDDFLRMRGLDAWKALPIYSAFEWRLRQFHELEDAVEICKKMVPLISNEPSAIEREVQCKILSNQTGVSLRSIVDELNGLLNEKDQERLTARKQVIERLILDLKRDPARAELLLNETKNTLENVSNKFNVDSLSPADFIEFVDNQKTLEEQRPNHQEGFSLGKDLANLEAALAGEWTQDVVLHMGGSPNSGKSSLLCKIAFSIAVFNRNTTVIYHTIDDSREQLLPRFISIADASRQLTINQVRNPTYWEKIVPGTSERRTRGYKVIKTLAEQNRLIIKDVVHGDNLTFAEGLIKYYQDKFPERKVVYILDNFHKLREHNHVLDERVRFKMMSSHLKAMACKLHIAAFCSVEYTKLQAGVKPTNFNIAESVKLEYDSNFIIHLFNEMGSTPHKYSTFHEWKDASGNNVRLPRIEGIVGKNKISEFKGSIYFNFWPASADFAWVDEETVLREQKMYSAGSSDIDPQDDNGDWLS